MNHEIRYLVAALLTPDFATPEQALRYAAIDSTIAARLLTYIAAGENSVLAEDQPEPSFGFVIRLNGDRWQVWAAYLDPVFEDIVDATTVALDAARTHKDETGMDGVYAALPCPRSARISYPVVASH